MELNWKSIAEIVGTSQVKYAQKVWTDISPKKINRWWINIGKDIRHHISLGNCKLKQWDAYTHLLEKLKSKTLMPLSAGTAVEQQEFSFIVGGNVKWYSHFERQFSVSYKTKHALTIWSSYHTFYYLPEWVETVCP